MAEGIELSLAVATKATPSLQNKTIRDSHRLIALDGGVKTLVSGALTLDPTVAGGHGFWTVAAETGTEDTITSISGVADGDVIILKADAGDTITIPASAPFAIASQIILSGDKIATLRYDGAEFAELSGSGGLATVQASAAVTAAPNQRVVTTNDTTAVAVTLPDNAEVGDVVEVVGDGDAGWIVKSNANANSQQIYQANKAGKTSTSSAVDLILSVNAHDAVRLICVVSGSDQVWVEVLHNVTIKLGNYFGDGSNGDLSTTGNVAIPSVTDSDMVVMNYKDLTVNAGHTLYLTYRCKGLVLFVDGDLVVNGTITMNARGAYVNPVTAGVSATGIRLPLFKYGQTDVLSAADFAGCGAAAIAAFANQPGVDGDGKIYKIERTGAAGAPTGTAQYGVAGGTGVNKTGGGGSGGYYSYWTGGDGAAGTCFSGGSGGGGAGRQNGGDAVAYGGAGGNAAGDNSGGGAGNPGGAPTGTGTAGQTGTGGVLIIIVSGSVTIGAGGIIRANGAAGGNGSGQAGGGGGSGGGIVWLLYRGTLTNNGTISANGGAGGAAWYSGGAGGAGTVVVEQID